jgi:diguanylate cyclase (GGDEF)-like protein
MLLALLTSACATPLCAEPATITSARAVHDLPPEQAYKGLPVHLVATVTYYQAGELFVEDASGGVYVKITRRFPIHRGDLVEITGVTAKSYRTIVGSDPNIRVINVGTRLPPKPGDYRSLVAGRLDCQYVWIEGLVRSANFETHEKDTVAQLELLVPGGVLQAYIRNYQGVDISTLIDARVRISGVAAGEFNGRWQLMRPIINASDARQLQVLEIPKVKPLDLPLTKIDDVVQTRYVLDQSKPVRVRGTITSSEPGYSAVIENNGESLLVLTRQVSPISIGAVVDVIGFAQEREYGPTVEGAEIIPTGTFEHVTPKPSTYQEALSGMYSDSLIQLRGQLLSELHGELSDSLVIMVDKHPVNLVMSRAGREPLPDLPVGTQIMASGICRITRAGSWGNPLLFRLDIGSKDDLQVIARPSWWTVGHLLIVVGALGTLSLLIAGWAVVLRCRVAAQTDQIKRSMQIDRQRARLLEKINSQTPLHDLLEDICGSISSLVPGVRCSCNLSEEWTAGAMRTGSFATESEAIFSTPITGRSGQQIGLFYVTGQDHEQFSSNNNEVFLIGAGLANLAVNQRHLYQELEYRSTHDQLTDLPNRRLSDDRLATTMLEARYKDGSFGVAYIDVDQFKQVNDRHGHKIGDLYLQQIASRLAAKVRSGDVLARVGGDEFLLIASSLQSAEDWKSYQQRLAGCFDASFVLDGIRLRGSASIGMAVYPHHGLTSEELKRHADMEMYAMKNDGRPTIGVSQRLAEAHLFSPADLQNALDTKRFILHYQAQFSASGRLKGMEALLRLDDPILGIVMPDAFINIAEHNDVILPLGNWVLRQALADAKLWQFEKMDQVRMVVNVAARQIARPGFAEEVELALEEIGMPPEVLELEITERTLVADYAMAAGQLAKLREIGVSISVDDFGTNYSCLSILHRLPVDTLKLDRSFVRVMSAEPNLLPVIKAIVEMGASMHKRIVAEGVESNGEITKLLQCGDMDFQGFVLSRPLPAGKICQLIERWCTPNSHEHQTNEEVSPLKS